MKTTSTSSGTRCHAIAGTTARCAQYMNALPRLEIGMATVTWPRYQWLFQTWTFRRTDRRTDDIIV